MAGDQLLVQVKHLGIGQVLAPAIAPQKELMVLIRRIADIIRDKVLVDMAEPPDLAKLPLLEFRNFGRIGLWTEKQVLMGLPVKLQLPGKPWFDKFEEIDLFLVIFEVIMQDALFDQGPIVEATGKTGFCFPEIRVISPGEGMDILKEPII
jgi:hypothetical protein